MFGCRAVRAGHAVWTRETEKAGPNLILIVDDIATNRDFLSDWITRRGYRPMTAENGPQALMATKRLIHEVTQEKITQTLTKNTAKDTFFKEYSE